MNKIISNKIQIDQAQIVLTYNKIGTTFKDGNLTLKVVPQKHNKPICNGCIYLSVRNCTKHGHACTAYLRPDKTHVIFIKV